MEYVLVTGSGNTSRYESLVKKKILKKKKRGKEKERKKKDVFFSEKNV